MSTLELSELLPQLGELTPLMVKRWIAASLAQSAALHEHDACLYPVDPARQASAERLHDAWRQWAQGAESLLRRAEILQAACGGISDLDELRDAVGRAQAMIAMPPALIARRRQQAQEGTVYSIEEVRRELRAGVRR